MPNDLVGINYRDSSWDRRFSKPFAVNPGCQEPLNATESKRSIAGSPTTKYTNAFKFLGRILPYPRTPLYQEYSDAGYLTAEWPLGQWDFVDPEASRVYEDVAGLIGPNPDITFDEAEAFFLSRLDDWDDVIAGRIGELAS
ncbi:hypothetical protein MSIMFI_05248 [Mycobacterium simulans]|uniref:hypothetical protein n=1 Tax=Mycobacterium simulans TaxID=627089 RepID=UPI0019BF6ACE|nr:hypothetical protein [Mycobacterium simulans]SON63717.1 hypothetical protein MSIMFI_05248 [Mycobacterium simulans]